MFDLILSDLHLTGDSGFDLCRRLKADPDLARLPVVICTAEADPLNVLRGLACGADSFFTKDRPPEKIIAGIQRVLARARAQGRSDGEITAGSVDAPIHVEFLNERFALDAGREQLVDVLVSAFEDVVHLNAQYQTAARALRERNIELQRLADSERQAREELEKAESQLVQAEKLSALGQMVAGVAHEINNPLAFTLNNLAVLRRDFGLIQQVLSRYQAADDTLAAADPERFAALREFAAEIDLEYTQRNLHHLLTRSSDGLNRIRRTVQDLRDFARLDEGDVKEVNLNDGIRVTLAVIGHLAAERQVAIRTELDETLPSLTCHPAQINQVVLNLVANAIDACQCRAIGQRELIVRTRPIKEGVSIEVADNGSGIDPSVRRRIFDPFFTTKSVGQGTGLGLSVSYGIVAAHGGRIDVESQPGQGARFVVILPIRARDINASDPPPDRSDP